MARRKVADLSLEECRALLQQFYDRVYDDDVDAGVDRMLVERTLGGVADRALRAARRVHESRVSRTLAQQWEDGRPRQLAVLVPAPASAMELNVIEMTIVTAVRDAFRPLGEALDLWGRDEEEDEEEDGGEGPRQDAAPSERPRES